MSAENSPPKDSPRVFDSPACFSPSQSPPKYKPASAAPLSAANETTPPPHPRATAQSQPTPREARPLSHPAIPTIFQATECPLIGNSYITSTATTGVVARSARRNARQHAQTSQITAGHNDTPI